MSRWSKVNTVSGWLIALIVFCHSGSHASAQTVDLELVLATDTSISVDAREYVLQMQGIARAFRQPGILRAIADMPDGVAVTLVHWSAGHLNRQAIDWSLLRTPLDALSFAYAVENLERGHAGRATSIGYAIDFSVSILNKNNYRGRMRKIDVSGDARSNSGPHPSFARDRAVNEGITVNGLSITGGDRGLHDYYKTNVIGGPGAFAMSVSRFEDFERAIYLKLLRELTNTSAKPPNRNSG